MFVGLITQLCSPIMCVCGVWTHVICVHTQTSVSIFHHATAQLFCLHCTLVWSFCHETHLLSSPDPVLALASMDLLTCLHPTRVWTNLPVGTMVQIMPGLQPYPKYNLWTRVESTNTRTLPYPRY